MYHVVSKKASTRVHDARLDASRAHHPSPHYFPRAPWTATGARSMQPPTYSFSTEPSAPSRDTSSRGIPSGGLKAAVPAQLAAAQQAAAQQAAANARRRPRRPLGFAAAAAAMLVAPARRAAAAAFASSVAGSGGGRVALAGAGRRHRPPCLGPCPCPRSAGWVESAGVGRIGRGMAAAAGEGDAGAEVDIGRALVDRVGTSLRSGLGSAGLLFAGGGDGSGKPVVLLLGCSGGCDSVALFHILTRIVGRDEDGWEDKYAGFAAPYDLHVAHFDHEQRGEESDGDREFVEDLCRRAGVGITTYRWRDAGGGGPGAGSFTQATARSWRNEALGDLLAALTSGGDRPGAILTAHHRDDSDETILLKLLRGAHVTSLSGMQRVRRDRVSDGEEGVPFVRPLLGTSRAEIERYLTSQGLGWREDSSNQSGKYLRNRVRNEVLPLLSDLVGGADVLHRRLESLEEQSGKLRQDLLLRAEQYVAEANSEAGSRQFPLPLDGDLSVVHEQALHQWVETASGRNVVMSYQQLMRLGEQISKYPERRRWKMNIGKGCTVERTGDILSLSSSHDVEQDTRQGSGRWVLAEAEDIAHDDFESVVLRIKLNFFALNRLRAIGPKKMFKLDNVAKEKASWTFVPPWRKGRSPIKVKDFLRGQKVPLHYRSGAPILYLVGDDTAVAVYVKQNDGHGKWIMHADFEAADDTNEERIVELGILRQISLE